MMVSFMLASKVKSVKIMIPYTLYPGKEQTSLYKHHSNWVAFNILQQHGGTVTNTNTVLEVGEEDGVCLSL